jgi:hypothetical protein
MPVHFAQQNQKWLAVLFTESVTQKMANKSFHVVCIFKHD